MPIRVQSGASAVTGGHELPHHRPTRQVRMKMSSWSKIMNRLKGYQLEFQNIPALASPAELEITVYRRKISKAKNEDGVACECHSDEATNLRLNDGCIAQIVSIPNLRRITVYDAPYFCENSPFFYRDGTPKKQANEYWFVHYQDHDEPRIGAGTVMILRRDTAEVVYRGGDGGE